MNRLSKVNGVVLVGGFGTRLRVVVPELPKVLAEISGKPFLFYILDQLSEAGLKTVILCTGYLGDYVKSKVGEKYRSLSIKYSHETTPLGTGGALSLALPYIQSSDVLVSNGDSYCSADLVGMWEWHMKKKAMATLLLTHMDDTSRYGHVSMASVDRIIGFNEKESTSKPGWINAGVYLIRRELLTDIPEKKCVSLEREVFPSWCHRGLYGYQTHSKFIDIGTPESYAQAERFFTTITI